MQTVIPMLTKRKRREPLPPWFKVKLPSGDTLKKFESTSSAVQDNSLHTVCEEARCPNIHDCWGRGTATFMVGGQTCTRSYRFCSVGHERKPEPPDPKEPASLAHAITTMGLTYAVITVVNRDDLDDEGAAHYRACLDAVHDVAPEVGLELLGSDMDGNEAALAKLLDGAPLKVFAHNVETVERLTQNVRDRRASFKRSVRILQASKELRPELMTKSSVMVGLGETDQDVTDTMKALRDAQVDILTFGQYLAPTPNHYPVAAYVTPNRFDDWKTEALDMGFAGIASGPLVRSSFRAGVLYEDACALRDSHKQD